MGLAAGEGLEDVYLVRGPDWVGEPVAVPDRLSANEDVHVFPESSALVHEVVGEARVEMVQLSHQLGGGAGVNLRVSQLGKEAHQMPREVNRCHELVSDAERVSRRAFVPNAGGSSYWFRIDSVYAGRATF